MTTLGLVINPTSGRGKGKIFGEKTKAELSKHEVTIVDLSANSFLEAMGNVKEAIAADTLSGLVVVGGDGMFHLAVNAVGLSGLPVGLVAAGTGNDSARALGLPILDVSAGVSRIIDKLNSPRTVDLIATESVGEVFYSFGAVSAGFDALVNRRANRWNLIRGPIKYRLAMYRELLAFKPIPYRLVIDGTERIFSANLCTITNSPSYGGGLYVTPEAKVDDGELDLFILNSISRLELIKLFPSVYEGKHVSHPAVEIHRAKRVEIHSEGMPAYSDGEYVGESPVICQVVKSALRVFA